MGIVGQYGLFRQVPAQQSQRLSPVREWTPFPAIYDGGPCYCRLDPWSRVEVAYEGLQEACLLSLPAADEPAIRAIAEVYARS